MRYARIGNGYSNLTYLAEDASGRRWVLRRPPLGELLESAHDVEREYRILAALSDTDVPAPAALDICREPAVCAAPLVLMEYVEGFVLDRESAIEQLSATGRAAVGIELARAMARIHAVDLEATGLTELSRSRTPYAARQLRRWRSQWDASKTRELPLVDELGERLTAAMPPPEPPALVHGDLHPMNALVSSAGEVLSVLDWELCTLGDPIADLGTLFAYWPQPGEPTGILFPASTYPGFVTREELSAAYAEANGRSIETVGYWHALGLWKLAVIAEGILRRSPEDPHNASRAGAVSADAIAELAERAGAVAAANGI
ncbi:MAG: phosphotransferase family protein [Solirubrobacterales bacterium]